MTSSTSRSRRFHARPYLEILECRRLPSTLVWTNRGSDAADTDQFNAVFGDRAATARSVVDAALTTWQNVIGDFHFADGSNTFSLALTANSTELDNGGTAWPGLRTDGQGKPQAGRVELGAGADGHGAGYFLDPDPYGSSAYVGTLLNSFTRLATPGGPANNQGDFLTIVMHEVGHTLGLNLDPNELFQRGASRFLQGTGQPDARDHPGTLFTFNGPDVQALFTSDDGDSQDTGTPVHLARPGNNYTDPLSSQSYSGADDLMNPLYWFGRRYLVSQTDALILKDVYGYSINPPHSFGSGDPPPPPPADNKAALLATSINTSAGPKIEVRDPATGTVKFSFLAYDASYTGSVRVAVGRISNDRAPVIVTAPGPGSPPRVRIFDGATGALLFDFLAYDAGFTGGVNVALGDINGDGHADIVTGAAAGNPHVKVYDGAAFANRTFSTTDPDASLLASFFPYALQFNVGANVAVGDIEHNGYGDIVTGAAAGNPDVRVYRGKDIATGNFHPNGASLLAQFFPYALQFNVGANVAVGDVNGDGFADIVTGATGGNPHVRIYDGKAIAAGTVTAANAQDTLVSQFFAYGMQFNVGVNVAVADLEGDGYADIITGATAGSPHVKIYRGQNITSGSARRDTSDNDLLTQFLAAEARAGTGVQVGAAGAVS